MVGMEDYTQQSNGEKREAFLLSLAGGKIKPIAISIVTSPVVILKSSIEKKFGYWLLAVRQAWIFFF